MKLQNIISIVGPADEYYRVGARLSHRSSPPGVPVKVSHFVITAMEQVMIGAVPVIQIMGVRVDVDGLAASPASGVVDQRVVRTVPLSSAVLIRHD